MKTLWINLIKYMQDLYSENCKMLLREIKEDPPPKWSGMPCAWLEDSVLLSQISPS